MYQYQYAYVKSNDPKSVWLKLDISDIPLDELLQSYREIVVILDHLVAPGLRTLDLNTLRVELSTVNLTIVEWLASIGSRNLNAKAGEPQLKTYRVRSRAAPYANYHMRLTDLVSAPDAELTDEMTSLALTKEGVDYKEFYEHVLVSVNGFMHLTDYDINAAYVIDARLTRDICQMASVGLHSFKDVGKLKIIPITEEKIFKFDEYSSFKDRFIIDLGVDHTDHSLAISIGGYFFIGETRLINRLGQNTISINWPHFNWIDRYFEMRRFLDVSSLGVLDHSSNKELVNIEQLNSDEVIKALLLMSQSFVVLIDTKELIVEKEPVRRGPAPSLFLESGHYPESMMMVGRGRIGEYWVGQESFVNVVKTIDSRYLDYEYSYAKIDELSNIDSRGVGAFPSTPDRIGPAHWLHISKRELTLP